MDRNREARRGSMAATNGLSRRRHRSEEDGIVELQETARLRDRVNKKDRDRDRSSRNKRRRGDRLMHGSNREDGGEDSTEESIDEEEEDEDEDSGGLRMPPPNPGTSSSLSNHHHQRKSFPPAKMVRAAPTWKVADEMIGVSVPRKARSASAKRSHECWMSNSIPGGGGAEQIHRQASTSPARPNATAASPAPISPSSSNVSVRKKMKPLGPKLRPSKMSKSSSSNQEDIEIEVAEVLYGLMRQSQCPPKQENLVNASQKLDSKDTNGSSNEVRSRVSSPISTSAPAAAHQPLLLPQNSCTSTTSLPVVAPKRKRPRPVKLEEESPAGVTGRNGSISSPAAKVENERPAKSETSSPKSEKNSGSASHNAGPSVDLGSSQPAAAVSSLELPQSAPVKAESNMVSDLKPLTEESETRVGVQTREEVPSPKKESPPCTKLDVDLEDATATKTISTAAEVECKREEKFKIDLMAPPPLKSSPERDGDVESVSDPKSIAPDVEMVPKAEAPTAEEKMEKIALPDAGEVRLEEKKTEQLVEESESQKQLANKERILDLQFDLEKPDKDGGTGSISGSKQQQQQPKTATRHDPKTEKTAQSTSLPPQMTLPGWPGGLPSLGYMPPLQAVLPLDGSTASSTAAVQPPHFVLSQPRPKRCATHYYIARNINYHQQFTRMNPFWSAAAGSASMYGAKPYNLNVAPPTESVIHGNPLQGNLAGRSLISVQDKVQASSTISGQNAKDKSSAPAAANFMDATQRKQLVMKQAPQPAAAGNLLHGPAFIFPLSQQQAAVAAGSRSGAVKSVVATGNAVLPGAANSGPVVPASSSSMAPGTIPTVSFNYPNLAANEAQYLAMLQNNGYPFLPAHVGAPPPYRGGSPAQAMSFINGSFYPPQMIHPSQLQQQAQQQSHSQPQAVQQGHPNTTTSSGSSSSQKHQQAQQQLLQGGGNNGGGGSSNNFTATKNRLPMQLHQQQQQQNHPVPAPNQSRQHEGEAGGEDSPSTADSRVPHAQKSIYGQNFAMPIHPQNFALISPAALGGGGGTGSHGEKQQQQQQSLKSGVELLPSQAFAMSFASFNGAATAQGLDFSSMAQNHAIFQSFPEAARHGYQMAAAAAAQAAQHKKNHHISEEGRTGGDSINVEDERKGAAGKGDFSSLAQNHAIFQSLPEVARHNYQMAAALAAQPKKNHHSEGGKTGGDSINGEDERKGTVGKAAFSSMAQNHAMFQGLPEAVRHSYQMAAAAAQAAQQKRNHHISEGGKTGGDSINVEDERKGTAGKADFSTMAQNHAMFQSLPEAARHSYQMAAAAAQAAQQKKHHHISEERKISGDSSNVEDKRKGVAGKATVGVGQSLAFSRPDSTDPSVSSVLGNTVIDSSARTLNLISAPINGNRAARPSTSTSTSTTAAPASSPITQHQQQQQQQLIQLKRQQQQQQQQQQHMPEQFAAAVAARSKTPSSSNASVYSDCLPSSAKFPNVVFPQALIQGSSPAQSPQWKNSGRTMGSTVPSPSQSSTSTSSLKNLPQQQSRIQQGHTHISFGVNTKQATAAQGQQLPMNNQSPSPPVVVGSPPTSSISKGAGGSPRTSSTGGKSGSSPVLPSQQHKSSQSAGHSRKSSPVGGRNVPSIIGNSHMNTAPSSCGQLQVVQQQHNMQKHTLQQPQLYFTNAAYLQAPSPQSINTTTTTTTTTTSTTGYYHQRRQNDQQQQQGASGAPSNGMLSLCQPSMTSDPAKAVAAAAAAVNGVKGVMPPSGLLQAAQFAAQTAGNAHQLMSAAFPYMHTMPTVSVKPAEQKQPAGSDTLHACWQPEKR
ncbi:protein TIME FOR COFFEE-like isoform X2 [Macadamia integrifolia]|uniref:protein TIME FOR COFFEE-like isoform X2 n=1 Tax=Macadamia integrifolia TaxID=60698 RepID=UPI001C4E373E|nr:protein TIME FOR COFFEE-like isoform X2 [Macadamia integrifolia]